MLDLGAGVGQWSFRFVERGASQVTAVEDPADLAEIGRREAQRRGVLNLQFVVSPAEAFTTDKRSTSYSSPAFSLYERRSGRTVDGELGEHLRLQHHRICCGMGQDCRSGTRSTTVFRSTCRADYSATYRTAREDEAL